jgi:mono/diheme cytochrome c family protein
MNLFKWDADVKESTVKAGEPETHWTFYFTNTSEVPVVITSAAASCGCTVPKLPPLPWTNAPGATGEIPVTMNLAGKPNGITFKTVTVNTDKGAKMLTVKVNIEAPPASAAPVMNREANQKAALSDRQAVFKGECVSCHVEKGKGKLGQELYVASCGICHDAEHRASAVPDLHALPHDTNADYWKTWIAQGKPGSMMPAFSTSEGGPLGEDQIASLVQYLSTTIPAQAQRHAKN